MSELPMHNSRSDRIRSGSDRFRPDPGRKPDWLKVELQTGPEFVELKRMIKDLSLHTVCEEARCPNLYECWSNRTATFMILGSICTRACGFCAVTSGRPDGLDAAEPERVAGAVARLGLEHVVITSVARDDLADGGAGIFAATIEAVRRQRPATAIEVLIPDFGGDAAHLETVLQARPDILNHNLETVARLTPKVRSRATYARSLELLQRSRAIAPAIATKSGLMLGLGETHDEIVAALQDMRRVGVEIVTLGQYLRPSPRHLPLERYVSPAEFAELGRIGLALGFRHVESGPLVRSSYHAHRQSEEARQAADGAG